MYYYTYTYMREEFKKNVSEWEQQYKYERDIVRSVPARETGTKGEETPTINKWVPG